MVVVISSPIAVTNEAAIINALFDEGLEILHVRKPNIGVNEIRILVEKIKTQHHHRISLHQHHELAGEFGTKRLHFSEVNRKEMSAEELILKATNHILSTSIHQVEEYDGLPNLYNYTFFGPVFNSISKQGYTSTLSDDFVFPVQVNHPRVIAIGGIDATNIQQAMGMKFNGIAVVGAIWQNPVESIQQFNALQKAWMQTGR